MDFTFAQYLGFLAFLIILLIGFWLMILLTAFIIPYWLTGTVKEKFQMKREAKRKALEEKV
jgi:predicted membrane protein